MQISRPAMIATLTVFGWFAILKFWVPGGRLGDPHAQGPLPAGTYMLRQVEGAANSEANLTRLEKCLKAQDEKCGAEMLSDGSALELKPGVTVRGAENAGGIFFGTVESGAYVGRTVYLPASALREST
jgi:hypothetical protein